MIDIRKIVSENLTALRKKARLTQLELAEKFNYSDKTISKWESGESLPSIEILYELARFYNVSIDGITTKDSFTLESLKQVEKTRSNKTIITLLSISAVWILSTILYVYTTIFAQKFVWVIFVWSVPISFLIGMIFNAIWGKRKITFYLLSCLLWSLLGCVFVQFLTYTLWTIFLLGFPLQLAIVLWSTMKPKVKHIDAE